MRKASGSGHSRFGVQSLLLLVLAAAMGFGWLRYANKQQEKLEEVEERADQQEILLDAYRETDRIGGGYGPAVDRTPLAASEFIRKLRQATDPNAQYELAWLLPESQHRQVVPLLVELYNEGNEIQRQHAVAALGSIGIFDEPSVVAALVNATEDSSVQVRCAALHSLGQTKSQSVKLAANEALEDDNPFVQIEAAKALCEVGEEHNAVSALVPLLESKDPDIVDGAFSAFVEKRISRRAGAMAVPALMKHIESSDWEIRLGALFALYHAGPREQVEQLLLNAMDDPAKGVRQEAAKLLRQLDSQTPITRPN